MAVGTVHDLPSERPAAPVGSDWRGAALVTLAVLVSAGLFGAVVLACGRPGGWQLAGWGVAASLVPGWLVLCVQSLYGSARSILPLALASGLFRMLTTIIVAFVAPVVQPHVDRDLLIGVLATTYFAALGAETWLLVRRLTPAA